MLKGSQVYLSPIQEKDLPELFAWINDRETVLYNASYRPISDLEHRSWYESLSGDRNRVFFLIRRVSDDGLIGSCQLLSIHSVYRNAELQVRIGRKESRGRGFGTEALKLLLRFAFDDLNLERVYLHVFETNKAAIRVYEKIGFVHEGILRKAAYINGEYLNLIVMGILKDEYTNR